MGVTRLEAGQSAGAEIMLTAAGVVAVGMEGAGLG